MTCTGHVRNGTIVLDEPLRLPEGSAVVIEVRDADTSPNISDQLPPTVFERLKPIVGAAKGLPEDAASNADHYLYGHPKS